MTSLEGTPTLSRGQVAGHPAMLRAVARPAVTFVKYYDKGSTDLGGEQIARGLQARGWQARTAFPSELGALPPGILVFLKTSRLDHLVRARLHGHRLVLDVQDTPVFKRHLKNRWLYDALIFKNARQLQDFGRRGSLDRVIYHQWDPRYRRHQATDDRLRLAYLGTPRSLALWERIPEVSFIDAPWFTAAVEFNCHLSIREAGRDALYKPNCKVSTAAACGANLITTADVSTVELLGADYPFYCTADLESISATIERTQQAFGGPVWELGLRRMQRVREVTRLDGVLDGYEELFAQLIEAHTVADVHSPHEQTGRRH
jgi:hypothetical protein